MTLAVEDASSKLLVVPNVEVVVRESAGDSLTTADGVVTASQQPFSVWPQIACGNV